MLDLKEMKYSSEDIGSAFKTLAHEYRWEFIIEDIDVCIQYFIYKISNIRKVVYNQKVLSEEHSGPYNTYFFEFIEDGHHYKIIQAANYLTQLLIDGESFDYNYTLERNKKEFDGNKFGRVDNIYNKKDDNSIQPSNEINFIKHDKPKQKFNVSIGIKNDNNIDNKQNKLNKLNKFKFGNGENNIINKNGNIKNENSNQKINNLIDFDNFNNDDNNHHNNINNFENANKINNNSSINIMNFQNNNNYNKIDNNNFNFNKNQNDFIQNNMNQNKNINSCNDNINKIRNLTDDYLLDNNIQNEDNYDTQNRYNNNNLNMNWNEIGNNLNYNNINLINSNNNNIMINDKGNKTNHNNNIDISYYGF